MMPKDQQRICLALGSIFGLRMLGLFMILPVFSVYTTHLLGATPTTIGIALGIYGLTQAMFQLPLGIWSDFIPRKKVIYIGLAIFVIGSLIAMSSHTITTMIIGRALQGAGAIGSTITALLGDLVDSEHRTKGMAFVGISIGISFMLAMILGPLLTRWIKTDDFFGLTTVFGLFAMLILLRYVPKPRHTHPAFQLKKLPQQISTVFFSPILFPLHLSIFISHTLLMAYFMAMPAVLIHQYHLPLHDQWKLYIPILFAVLLLIGGRMRKKNFAAKEKREVLFCITSVFLSQLLILRMLMDGSDELFLLYLSTFLFFFGFTFLEALLPSMVSKAVDASLRGTATGIFSTCQFLGIFCGSLWGGLLAQKSQAFGVIFGNSLLASAWLLVMLALYFLQKEHPSYGTRH